MRKFYLLVKKEIKELLTLQMILPLVGVILVFVFIGNLAGKESKKSQVPPNVVVLNLDHTQAAAMAVETLKTGGLNVNELSSGTADEAVAQAKTNNDKAALVIPAGFENSLKQGKPAQIEYHALLRQFSVNASKSFSTIDIALAAVNEKLSNQLIAGTGAANPAFAKHPLAVQNFVVVGDRQAQISLAAVSGFINSQTTFIPIILFLVITFSTQMIALSMATEKENKTLETLLSSPINRKTIVASKLVGAGLVALITAVLYMFGLQRYISGLTGSGGGADQAAQAALSQLGLAFRPQDYVLLGIVLFAAILVALSIAIILGSFAEDVKSVQGITMPLMVLVLIPYFLTLLLDISTLSPFLRAVVYAIPFTHAFLAAPNILLHQYTSLLYGLLYLIVLFVIFVYLASKLFASDKILTLKINFFKKNKF